MLSKDIDRQRLMKDIAEIRARALMQDLKTRLFEK